MKYRFRSRQTQAGIELRAIDVVGKCHTIRFVLSAFQEPSSWSCPVFTDNFDTIDLEYAHMTITTTKQLLFLKYNSQLVEVS